MTKRILATRIDDSLEVCNILFIIEPYKKLYSGSLRKFKLMYSYNCFSSHDFKFCFLLSYSLALMSEQILSLILIDLNFWYYKFCLLFVIFFVCLHFLLDTFEIHHVTSIKNKYHDSCNGFLNNHSNGCYSTIYIVKKCENYICPNLDNDQFYNIYIFLNNSKSDSF